MNVRNIFLSMCLLTVGACGGSGGGAAVPPVNPPVAPVLSVTTQAVFTNLTFTLPVAMKQAPNATDRWFVVEKDGVVRVFNNDQQANSSNVFVDISSRVSSNANEAGLLGMAFHPDFASNGEVFLSYTRAGSPLESVISRYRSFDGGATLDSGSEEILLTVLQDFSNHNGGHIEFDANGLLFIGLGDGGDGNDPNNRAQTNTTLMGKLLRIDVDGGNPFAIPADNPFAGNSVCIQGFGGADCPEIYASGLRNPWRFSFDGPTGDLWLGDVGQSGFEEINLITLGGNYGWRIREGANCANPTTGCQTTGLIDPMHQYDHSVGQSVVGGHVYRGTGIPLLTGRYVFADTINGRVFALLSNPTMGSGAELLEDTTMFISSFGQDTSGELFVIDYNAGTLHQLVPGT